MSFLWERLETELAGVGTFLSTDHKSQRYQEENVRGATREFFLMKRVQSYMLGR